MSRSVYQLGTTSLVVISLLMLCHFIYKRSTEASIRGILLDDSSQMQRQKNLSLNSCKNQEDTSIDAGKPPGQRYISFFEDPCKEVPLPSLVEFFKYLNTVTIICRNKVSFGGEIQSGSLDGNKFICMDPPYGLAQVNCTVFSFGINNEWSFDDAMDHKGCKVYAFDPTMGKESHYRTPNIRFFNIGVGGEDVTMQNGIDEWKFMTYKSIVKLTSTENSPIDYFKIDVEGSEVSFFQEALYNSSQLLKKVKQIGMEIHPGMGESLKGLAPKYWELFQKLECLGFRLMHMNLNMVGANSYTENGTIYSGYYELVWMMENPVE